MTNPYGIVDTFEKTIAEYAGSKYAVAVESCTAAIFLSLMYQKINTHKGRRFVLIPSRTYPSIPCSIIHAGLKVKFKDWHWSGEYELWPYNIWDAALRFKKGMYNECCKESTHTKPFQCLSFHIKKLLPIGRGGMILTDDEAAYKWLKKARFDGREPVPLLQDNFTMLGWNMYMQPADAARGLQYFQMIISKHPEGLPDLLVSEQGYPNLDLFDIYKQ